MSKYTKTVLGTGSSDFSLTLTVVLSIFIIQKTKTSILLNSLSANAILSAEL